MKYARIGVLVLALAGVAAFMGVGLPEGAKGDSSPTTRGITVTGSGKVTVFPDQAGFTFGVENQAGKASDALAQTNSDMQKLIDALQQAGVKDKDIQTSQISLSPNYDENGQRITGYTASNSVTATTSIGNAGTLVDAAVSAGATNVDGPNLSRSNQDALYRDALRSAVDDARSRAEALASASGVSLGAVISVHENDSYSPGPIAYDMAATAASPAPIKAGTQDVEASVTVTFAIS